MLVGEIKINVSGVLGGPDVSKDGEHFTEGQTTKLIEPMAVNLTPVSALTQPYFTFIAILAAPNYFWKCQVSKCFSARQPSFIKVWHHLDSNTGE